MATAPRRIAPARSTPRPPTILPTALLAVVGLLTVVALLAAAPAADAQQPPELSMNVVVNDVQGTPPDGFPAPLAVGDALVVRQLVETGDASRAGVAVGQAGSISIGEETRLRLDQNVIEQAVGPRSRLSLLLGSIRVTLGELFTGRLDVETPEGSIGIKGTDVEIEVTEAGITVVTVFEGVVEVLSKAGGAALLLREGFQSVIVGGRPPTPPSPIEPGTPGSSVDSGNSEPGQPGDRGAEPEEPGRNDGREEPGRESESDTGDQQQQQADSDPGPAGFSCSSIAEIGKLACVCGDLGGGTPAVTVDGRPITTFHQVTPTAATFIVPVRLKPGEHVLAGPGGRCTMTAIKLELDFDAKKFQRRKKTDYRINVEGTREPIDIRLINRDPTELELEGGDEQVVTTRGGRRNRVDRELRRLGRGDGRIDRELAEDYCPCRAALPPG